MKLAHVDLWCFLNTNEAFSGALYDEKFIFAVSKELIGFNGLSRFELPPNIVKFIQGKLIFSFFFIFYKVIILKVKKLKPFTDLFEIRVLRSEDRLARFYQYIDNVCKKCKETRLNNEKIQQKFR